MLKVMLGLLALGFLFLARGLRSLSRSSRPVKERRQRWDDWAEEDDNDEV